MFEPHCSSLLFTRILAQGTPNTGESLSHIQSGFDSRGRCARGRRYTTLPINCGQKRAQLSVVIVLCYPKLFLRIRHGLMYCHVIGYAVT